MPAKTGISGEEGEEVPSTPGAESTRSDSTCSSLGSFLPSSTQSHPSIVNFLLF